MAGDRILLLGVNHKKTPLEVREKLALSSGYEEPLQALGKVEGLREYYLPSTCNRVEILVSANEGVEVEDNLARFLFGETFSPEQYREYMYVYHNEEAVHHLFMVAASLDSMIVGEAQILGQLKEAYRWSAQEKCTGPVLNKLLHKAFSVAKRVRTETRIGSSAVSISYAAIELARKIFGSLENNMIKGFHYFDQSQCFSFFYFLAQGDKGRRIRGGIGIKNSSSKCSNHISSFRSIDFFGSGIRTNGLFSRFGKVLFGI